MLWKYECSSLATQKPTLDRLTLLLGTAMGIFTMMLGGDGHLRYSPPPFMDKVRVSYCLLQTEVIWGLLSCVSMPLDPWLEKGHQDRMRGKDPQNSEVESRKSHPPCCREYFHTPTDGGPTAPMAQHGGQFAQSWSPTTEAEHRACLCDVHSTLESKQV